MPPKHAATVDDIALLIGTVRRRLAPDDRPGSIVERSDEVWRIAAGFFDGLTKEEYRAAGERWIEMELQRLESGWAQVLEFEKTLAEMAAKVRAKGLLP